MLVRPFAVLALVVAFGAGCSSSSAPATPGGAEDAVGAGGLSGDVSCTTDPRVDTYTAGLSKDGAGSALTFQLAESDPAPPAKGGNTFEVLVTDSEGAPMTGDLRVDLFMPDHGHGTSVVPVVSYDEASGRFTIAPLYLFMAGVWRITLELYADTDAKVPLDHTAFYFCVEG